MYLKVGMFFPTITRGCNWNGQQALILSATAQ